MIYTNKPMRGMYITGQTWPEDRLEGQQKPRNRLPVTPRSKEKGKKNNRMD
jgi:hypothetical protein